MPLKQVTSKLSIVDHAVGSSSAGTSGAMNCRHCTYSLTKTSARVCLPAMLQGCLCTFAAELLCQSNCNTYSSMIHRPARCSTVIGSRQAACVCLKTRSSMCARCSTIT